MAENDWIRSTLDMDSEKASEFIRKLGEDDDFRAELESDPERVLREQGLYVSAELIPQEVRLPSKEDIQRLIELLERFGDELPRRLRDWFQHWYPFWFRPLLHDSGEDSEAD